MSGSATPLEPRMVDGPAMLLAGLRRTHGFAESAASIPQQWAEFSSSGLAPPHGGVAFGVLCGSDPAARTFEYMCAVEVPSFDHVPPGTGRMRVPAQRYAVFTYDGHVGGLSAMWARVWNEWLPTSGYHIANTPEFERYDHRFDETSSSGVVEIWCSVRSARLIDEPRIAQTDAQSTAVIHLTIPRDQIQQVMGPAVQEVLAVVKQLGLAPSGPVFSHHFAMSPDVFDFEVGVPVPTAIAGVGRVRGGTLPSVAAATTTYRGSYGGLPAAWGEFDAWMRAHGHAAAPDLWESYARGPETSPDPSSWQTILVRPLA